MPNETFITMSIERYEELIGKEIRFDMYKKHLEGEKYVGEFERSIFEVEKNE